MLKFEYITSHRNLSFWTIYTTEFRSSPIVAHVRPIKLDRHASSVSTSEAFCLNMEYRA